MTTFHIGYPIISSFAFGNLIGAGVMTCLGHWFYSVARRATAIMIVENSIAPIARDDGHDLEMANTNGKTQRASNIYYSCIIAAILLWLSAFWMLKFATDDILLLAHPKLVGKISNCLLRYKTSLEKELQTSMSQSNCPWLIHVPGKPVFCLRAEATVDGSGKDPPRAQATEINMGNTRDIRKSEMSKMVVAFMHATHTSSLKFISREEEKLPT